MEGTPCYHRKVRPSNPQYNNVTADKSRLNSASSHQERKQIREQLYQDYARDVGFNPSSSSRPIEKEKFFDSADKQNAATRYLNEGRASEKRMDQNVSSAMDYLFTPPPDPYFTDKNWDRSVPDALQGASNAEKAAWKRERAVAREEEQIESEFLSSPLSFISRAENPETTQDAYGIFGERMSVAESVKQTAAAKQSFLQKKRDKIANLQTRARGFREAQEMASQVREKKAEAEALEAQFYEDLEEETGITREQARRMVHGELESVIQEKLQEMADSPFSTGMSMFDKLL